MLDPVDWYGSITGKAVKEVGMYSRLSSKGQVTIPKEAREAIRASASDLVSFEIVEDAIVLRKVTPFDAAFHRALSETLDEWNSPEDEEAFGDL